jgi:RNase P subunit RPR2
MSKQEEARKPLSAYTRETHFADKTQQLFGNALDIADLRAMLTDATAVSFVKIGAHIKDRFCPKCKQPKFYVVAKNAPQLPLRDKKLVVCVKCARIITAYLNERSHGNTPLRPDQIARGITTAKKACCGAVYGVAHDTQEKVDNACKDFCPRHPSKRKVVK